MSQSLAAARLAANLSVAEVSRRSGRTVRTIYRLEKGTTRPTHDTVVALEAAIGLPPGSLIFGAAVIPDRRQQATDAPVAERRRLQDRRSGGRRRANRTHQPDRRKAAR